MLYEVITGFEAIDIWSAHQGCPHLDDVAKRLGSEGLKELLAKNKLKLFAFSVYSGGYERYAELLGKAGGGVAVRGSSQACKPEELVITSYSIHYTKLYDLACILRRELESTFGTGWDLGRLQKTVLKAGGRVVTRGHRLFA